MSLTVLFMGTPEAAVPTLNALIDSEHSVVGVVTSPDKPRGRGMNLEATPVKKRATEAGLEVITVTTLRSEETQGRLATFDADVFVVTAFGFILPPQVLKTPALGCINVHFSLLPRWRGAAPVQWALIEGDPVTGVTIMQMDEGLDTGPVFAAAEERINEDDTAGTLEARLAVRGGALLVETLGSIEAEELSATPQDNDLATIAPKISRDQAHVDWSRPATRIVREIRAFNPRPVAWGVWRDKRLKLWRARADPSATSGPPGEISVEGEQILVGAGTARVLLMEVQPEGRSRMPGPEFVRGYRPESGEVIG